MNQNEMLSLDEQIANLKQKSDAEIDFSDIPEILDWSKAIRGKFYRPNTEQVCIRLDAEVLAWFRNKEEKYQSAINSVLREYMLSKLPKS